MNILIVQNTFSSCGFYDSNHTRKIQRQGAGLHVCVVDPTRKDFDALVSKMHIIVSGRREYETFVDIRNAKNLQWVHIASAGIENIARVLRPTNILLTNSSGASANSIVEHVFTYMLMFARRIHIYYRAQIIDKKWLHHTQSNEPFELGKKTIGIGGFGRIGRRIAKRAKQFAMHVVALEHNQKIKASFVDRVVPSGELNALLEQSDFVVDCLPLTPKTQRFFSRQQFIRMKKSAFFINVGRGKTVAQDDLVRVLREERLAGAGLDVFEEEPLPQSSQLWHMPSVIMTPHYAGRSPHYIDRVVDNFCINLSANVRNGHKPNVVNKNLGY
ncbi:MAG: D-2-hydroxyacid dehydrogenase [bacterium]|nr:D-2-hydroxyacid dehydrogenase [bacterium]